MLPDILTELLNRFQQLLYDLINYVPRLLAGLIVAALTLIIIRLIRRWGQKAAARLDSPPEIEQLIVNAIYFGAILVGLTVTLNVLGANVTGMVAGLGIGGLVVGFAIKDIIENLLAGVLILIRKPFAPGHVIELEGISGTVIRVEVSTTTLKTFDNVEVVIPNRTVYTAVIKNYSTYKLRRRSISLRLGVSSNTDEAIEKIVEAVSGLFMVAENPRPSVILEDFGEKAITGTLYFYIDTAEHDLGGAHSAVLMTVQDVIKKYEIEIVHPAVVVNR